MLQTFRGVGLNHPQDSIQAIFDFSAIPGKPGADRLALEVRDLGRMKGLHQLRYVKAQLQTDALKAIREGNIPAHVKQAMVEMVNRDLQTAVDDGSLIPISGPIPLD